MKKTLVLAVLAILTATQLAAASSYWVVMKDGTRYEARAKWTVANGKATMTLTNGSVLALDPSAIDAAKSEEVTRLGGGEVLGVEQPLDRGFELALLRH
jgi:outer membrane lipoprotein SlyB